MTKRKNKERVGAGVPLWFVYLLILLYSIGTGYSMIPVPVIGRCVRLVGNGGK